MSAPPLTVRPELPDDAAAVAAVNAVAFGGDQVPRMVEALRETEGYQPSLCFVAVEGDGEVVGHVMLTRFPLETAPGRRAGVLCLSPLAVHPRVQGRGLGRRLVATALAAAEAAGEHLVVLEGNPALYRRFRFVDAEAVGLRRASERTPRGAFQVCLLPADDGTLRGRVLYPQALWDLGCVGLPMEGVAWLDALEGYARAIEDAALAGGAVALAAPVPTCPGWDVARLLAHLGAVHRVVVPWLEHGRRPRAVPSAPVDGDVVGWYAAGWRSLHDALDARPAAAPAATWSPWEATAGFWRRRQVHEHAVHALDVALALGTGSAGSAAGAAAPTWSVTDDVALDGIDEVVRLWLGTRLAGHAGGDGALVRLVAGDRLWTVGLHGQIAEVHDLPTPPDAVVSAAPGELYRWLWNRGGTVDVDGDPVAVAALRAALDHALQ